MVPVANLDEVWEAAECYQIGFTHRFVVHSFPHIKRTDPCEVFFSFSVNIFHPLLLVLPQLFHVPLVCRV